MFTRAILVNKTKRTLWCLKYGWGSMDLCAFEDCREGPYRLRVVNKIGGQGPEPGMLL